VTTLAIEVFCIFNVQEAKRKRRSKNEQEGRSFRCDTCGKSYLSQPALTNHNKTKHFQNDPCFKRGRGRPRKNVSFLQNDKNLFQIFNLKKAFIFFQNKILIFGFSFLFFVIELKLGKKTIICLLLYFIGFILIF